MVDQTGPARARDFELLVERALSSILDIESIERAPRLFGSVRPDFIAHLRNGSAAIVEVKVVTPATSIRLNQAAAQLRSHHEAYRKVAERSGPPPELVLVVSGALAPERVAQLRSLGVDTVIDGPTLRRAAPELPWPDSVASEYPDTDVPQGAIASTNAQLIRELEQVAPGQAEWALYQRKVRDILTATLCPPLEQPLDEHPNMAGVNRRDIIFPNYADNGVWKFLRDHYEAHFVVVDTKNYSGFVTKSAILQIANYLSAHGAGLFGIIACRNGASHSADVTRREQWIIHRKLIIILTDDDLKQMVSFASNRSDPGIVIRQKIEDFRLAF